MPTDQNLAVAWLAEHERHRLAVEELLRAALTDAGGFVLAASRLLGVTEGALRRQLERHPAIAAEARAMRESSGWTAGNPRLARPRSE
jgi:hypothetical protein